MKILSIGGKRGTKKGGQATFLYQVGKAWLRKNFQKSSLSPFFPRLTLALAYATFFDRKHELSKTYP
jgi:hypothetical protein